MKKQLTVAEKEKINGACKRLLASRDWKVLRDVINDHCTNLTNILQKTKFNDLTEVRIIQNDLVTFVMFRDMPQNIIATNQVVKVGEELSTEVYN